MEWFRLGGWGMYPILVVGLVGLGAAAFYAARGDGRLRGSLEATSRALAWFIATAVASDLIAVCFALRAPDIPDSQRARILLEGIGESLTPLTMGGAFMALMWLFIAIGQRRVDQRV